MCMFLLNVVPIETEKNQTFSTWILFSCNDWTREQTEKFINRLTVINNKLDKTI